MKKRLLIGAMVLTLVLLVNNLCARANYLWKESKQFEAKEVDSLLEASSAIFRGKIALTFDDGPHPEYTKEILDFLSDKEVKASFFVLGKLAREQPELILRMKEEGHVVGNHTYSHIQYTPATKEIFCEELVKTNLLLEEITGEAPQYVRPPYGCFDKSLEDKLNMISVLWNNDPQDWCTYNEDIVADRVITNAKDGGIILMHDYYESTVEAVKQIVVQLQNQGYEFVTVDEILLD